LFRAPPDTKIMAALLWRTHGASLSSVETKRSLFTLNGKVLWASIILKVYGRALRERRFLSLISVMKPKGHASPDVGPWCFQKAHRLATGTWKHGLMAKRQERIVS